MSRFLCSECNFITRYDVSSPDQRPPCKLCAGKTVRYQGGRQQAFGGHGAGCWPRWSDAAGVNPAVRHLEMQRLKEDFGIDANINEEGQIEMRDKDHQDRILKALGMFDRNSVSGPTPLTERERHNQAVDEMGDI